MSLLNIDNHVFMKAEQKSRWRHKTFEYEYGGRERAFEGPMSHIATCEVDNPLSKWYVITKECLYKIESNQNDKIVLLH